LGFKEIGKLKAEIISVFDFFNAELPRPLRGHPFAEGEFAGALNFPDLRHVGISGCNGFLDLSKSSFQLRDDFLGL
jgi:hypothetical protein